MKLHVFISAAIVGCPVANAQPVRASEIMRTVEGDWYDPAITDDAECSQGFSRITVNAEESRMVRAWVEPSGRIDPNKIQFWKLLETRASRDGFDSLKFYASSANDQDSPDNERARLSISMPDVNAINAYISMIWTESTPGPPGSSGRWLRCAHQAESQ